MKEILESSECVNANADVRRPDGETTLETQNARRIRTKKILNWQRCLVFKFDVDLTAY